jgi:predicted TIM-barrel fold metal-dependent hydrolase
MRFGIVRDPLALQMRDLLPVEDLMWGSDFPHSVTSYPRTREWLEIIFSDAPAELRRKILVDNPVEFFTLDATATLTETPA